MHHYKLTLTSATPLDFSQPVTIQPDQILAVASTQIADIQPPEEKSTHHHSAATVAHDPKAYTLELLNRAFKCFLKDDYSYTVEQIKEALTEDEDLEFKEPISLSVVCVLLDALTAQRALRKVRGEISALDRYLRILPYTTSFNTDGSRTIQGPAVDNDAEVRAQILPLFQDGQIHTLVEVFEYLKRNYPTQHSNLDGRHRVAILEVMSRIVQQGTLVRPAGMSERYHLPMGTSLDGVLSTIDI